MNKPGLALRWFFVVNYLLLTVMLAGAMKQGYSLGPAGIAFATAAALGYALLFVAPLAVLAGSVGRWLPWLGYSLATLLAAATVLALYADFRIHALYGFHFNGFVWNLLTTPGGIDSMGGSDNTLLGVAAIATTLVLIEGLLLALCRWMAGRGHDLFGWLNGRLRYLVIVTLLVLGGVQISYGFGRILAWEPVLASARQVPLFIPTTVRGMAGVFGIQARRQVRALKSEGALNYPLHPLRVAADAPSPNIIMLVSESLRADMLTPEIMPNLWRFAGGAQRFTNHYSGGNGTRMGIFSLMYGLPGNYWFPFLDERKPPVLVDELQRRHYRLGLYASSEFTYPEFDKTVFAHIATDQLHQDTGLSWQADRRNVKRLLGFLDQARADSARPWFAYLFFNSPHARYYFPPESVIRPDYLKDFNYAREDSADIRRDIKLIENRYINAVHHLDQQLGRVFDYVNAHDMKKDTIVIVTGDHAEEFMDQGRWGHNSELHNAQIHTPLVIWIPGRGHGVHDYPTSHLDLVPTLLPLMGVQNPTEDYSAGRNLFDPAPGRYRLAASWNALAYIGPRYKVAMPLRAGGLANTAITRADDEPVADEDGVLASVQARLAGVLKVLSRYYRKS